MILTGRELAEMGELLHGPDWRAWLARKLGRSERQVRRYENGTSRIPVDFRDQLLAMIREQCEKLEAWERELSA